jgi:hypothetical protein
MRPRDWSLSPFWTRIHGHLTLINRRKSNPAAIDPNHPQAPKSHPLPIGHPHVKPHRTATLEDHIVYWCHISLAYAGKMTYTENWTLRQRFFRFAVGVFFGASSDCSQFVATILKWCGVKTVTSTDYTGTLLQKGKRVSMPGPGIVAVWGPGTGTHTAFITEHIAGGADWYCVGFGHQGAPDRNTLSGMNAYFQSIGKPGVRYLDFER